MSAPTANTRPRMHDLHSAADFCEAWPEKAKALIDALDLSHPGLEAVRVAVHAGDLPAACEALLAYYAGADTCPWLRIEAVPHSEERYEKAEPILADTFTCYHQTDRIPRRENGGLDWTYNGPEDDEQWGMAINRMQWGRTLVRAYAETGNPVYAACFDALLQDWAQVNPYPAKHSRDEVWTGLNVYFRLYSAFAPGFYGLQRVPEFRPATRLLILSAVPEHADYQVRFHAKGGNWITMEMLGLATAGVCWPEFKEAAMWRDYAAETMTRLGLDQVYPDGAQKELTYGYHLVALYRIQHFVELFDQSSHEVPAELRELVKRMVAYLPIVLRPDGTGLLNNDSELRDMRERILEEADVYNRPDWRYIATQGTEGERPADPPSRVAPWAGQVVMRSGWESDADWAFFDVGPFGTGHQHPDKLHLSVMARGRNILVDGGRYTYKNNAWRAYFRHSRSHNVILLDGRGQGPDIWEAEAPIEGQYKLREEADAATATFDAGFAGLEGEAAHTRGIVYRRGGCWFVVDRIASDRPREAQALWHFHPDCVVLIEGGQAFTAGEGKGHLRIVPLGPIDWLADVVCGQEEPEIQGWWSKHYNHIAPAPCLRYTGPIENGALFGWLMIPGDAPVPAPVSTAIEPCPGGAIIRCTLKDGDAQTTFVPLERVPADWHPDAAPV